MGGFGERIYNMGREVQSWWPHQVGFSKPHDWFHSRLGLNRERRAKLIPYVSSGIGAIGGAFGMPWLGAAVSGAASTEEGVEYKDATRNAGYGAIGGLLGSMVGSGAGFAGGGGFGAGSGTPVGTAMLQSLGKNMLGRGMGGAGGGGQYQQQQPQEPPPDEEWPEFVQREQQQDKQELAMMMAAQQLGQQIGRRLG